MASRVHARQQVAAHRQQQVSFEDVGSQGALRLCAQIKAAADAEVRSRMEAALKERLAQDAAARCGRASRAAPHCISILVVHIARGEHWCAGRHRQQWPGSSSSPREPLLPQPRASRLPLSRRPLLRLGCSSPCLGTPFRTCPLAPRLAAMQQYSMELLLLLLLL